MSDMKEPMFNRRKMLQGMAVESCFYRGGIFIFPVAWGV